MPNKPSAAQFVTFAKLFDTKRGQLLAFKDETDEGDPCVTVIAAPYAGVAPKVKLSGWDDHAGQQRAFDKIDQEHAEEMADKMRAMITGMGQESA